MTSNAKIIEVATLVLKCDQTGNADDLRQLDQELSRFEAADHAALTLAYKLMEGKPFRMTSDNPETIRRSTAIAQQIGATFDDTMDDPLLGPKLGMTSITFFPPLRLMQ